MTREDRRGRILRAAAELFIARGFAGVSMDDVLAAVGGSKSTLYRYFSDKDQLFRAAVEMIIDRRAAALRDFQPIAADIPATLREFGRYFAKIVLEPEAIALHRLVTAEAERVHGIGETYYRHGPAAGQMVIAGYLRSQMEAGLLDIDDPVLAAAQLHHAMHSDLQMRLLLQVAPEPTEQEVSQSIAAAVDTFLHGIGRQNERDAAPPR